MGVEGRKVLLQVVEVLSDWSKNVTLMRSVELRGFFKGIVNGRGREW